MNKALRLSIPIILAGSLIALTIYLSGASHQAMASGEIVRKSWMDTKVNKEKMAPQSTVIVTTLDDELNDDGDCSLREAIAATNDNETVDACPAGDALITDTITFNDPGMIMVDSQLTVTGGGPLEIDGENMITISGGGLSRIFWMEYGSAVTLRKLAVVDGYAVDGAGIYNNGGNVTIEECDLSGNRVEGGAGGAIYNTSGNLAVINTTITGNSAPEIGGGGIFNGFATLSVTGSSLSDNYANNGGGIRNDGGTAIVMNSTLTANSAQLGGAITNMGTLTVTNSTLSGNYADQVGAAIYNWFFATVSNSTLVNNNAVYGGSISNSYITMTITSTIITNNAMNCSGPITDGGHNISSDDTCGFDPANGSMPNTDPLLGALQDNGGATWTHALLMGSPAIDNGDNELCPGTDQRGVLRPQDGNNDGSAICDIGSYELESLLTPPGQVTVAGVDDGVALASYTFTATVEPLSATLPLEYIWQATGQPEIIHSGGLSDTIIFAWEQPGTKVITITASNLAGTVTDTHTIAIADVPISGLEASNDSPTPLGETTALSATVQAGTNVIYTWDFGDSEYGSGQYVNHTYPAVGVFTATVTASNDAGSASANTGVIIQDVPISGLAATNDSPTQLGETTAISATVQAGSNVIYTWDFGDGESGSGQYANHTYPSVGIYTATVTASNDAGSVSANTEVIVQDVPISGLAATNDSPTWLGETTALSATLQTGTNVIYAWDFGDGGTGNGQFAVHTYAYAGIYTATVTATNGIGSANASTEVTIQDVPISGLAATNDSPTLLGETTIMSATLQAGSNVVYSWDFGDGETGSGQIVTHVYLDAGIFTARVTASNPVSSITTSTQVEITLPVKLIFLPLVTRLPGESTADGEIIIDLVESVLEARLILNYKNE